MNPSSLPRLLIPPTRWPGLVLALMVAACAGPATAPPVAASAAPRPSTGDEPGHAHATAAVADGPPAAGFEVPVTPGPGPAREAKVAWTGAGLKVATIVLRAGEVLPEHDAPAAVTIVALRGAGTVLASGQRLRLDAGHAVGLAARVPHLVEPDPGTDLVLLVHHAVTAQPPVGAGAGGGR